ncbi:hypothetical protein A3K48_06310 [candidate division WOR-1 bacterium RIFOXYA12_FULL_52_29]|uniref:Uncharacterized protein n=1 Tax=candidate division WOR-1 bacterium RIFOXYC12_FULL_54_18 TaxID=1802584 RepID=A0A1F4T7T2_UNCSA|nr:MAG: hypothetical protein A3K44_06310 [candidate division WOR-1 bacterium RIFOXYA2_FULL_51_19]OGC18142.1 MAG: hypothetical protein A3K48_06310 [candidate division WOR-1 bacterium RIFOXYA12_FULL_52_29]OGC26997.1 MAG: hypothetical protein A3K32_06305 [candidate division WOR-1 bacterium RIFOXYB2_FULL_45_9]OGC28559.1 MAG: hypothetical protein A3K49_06310 [candidate division WOR-1 bacterium RIFOXYC12_FULL_54_18]OGC30986.1 MAG: hypothetical protein A2346_06310 [candidate division WOR-1 bacterium R
MKKVILFLLVLSFSFGASGLMSCQMESKCCCSGEESCWVTPQQVDAVSSANKLFDFLALALFPTSAAVQEIVNYSPIIVCRHFKVVSPHLISKIAHPSTAPPLTIGA